MGVSELLDHSGHFQKEHGHGRLVFELITELVELRSQSGGELKRSGMLAWAVDELRTRSVYL